MRDRKMLEIICGLRQLQKEKRMATGGVDDGVRLAVEFIEAAVLADVEQREQRKSERRQRVTRVVTRKAGRAEMRDAWREVRANLEKHGEKR